MNRKASSFCRNWIDWWILNNPDRDRVIKGILAFINTANWDESQRVVESNAEMLLSENIESAFEILLAQAVNVEDKRIFQTHRSLLRRCREIGISAAFDELKTARRDNPGIPLIPVELIPVGRHLEQVSPARMRAYLDENPQTRDVLAELGIIERRQNTSVESIILAFINASSWAEKKQFAQKNPRALFSAAAVIFFEEALHRARAESNQMDVMVLEGHQKLLTRCQEIGIDEAFAEAEAALQAARDEGYDLSPPPVQ